MSDKGYLVHRIIRDHFQREDNSLRKLEYSKQFNRYFFYIYSKEEIPYVLCSTPVEIDEVIELLLSVSAYLLEIYGYSPICKDSWKTMGREWKYYKTIDALTLAKDDVLLNKEFPVLENVPFQHPRVEIPFRNWDFSLYNDIVRVFF